MNARQLIESYWDSAVDIKDVDDDFEEGSLKLANGTIGADVYGQVGEWVRVYAFEVIDGAQLGKGHSNTALQELRNVFGHITIVDPASREYWDHQLTAGRVDELEERD